MFDLVEHLRRQQAFSLKTFGPGVRVKSIIDHIRKELVEVEQSGGWLDEWIDVVILAFDGAWRSGASPAMIVQALENKQIVNERRAWPDWRTAEPDKAIEHKREEPSMLSTLGFAPPELQKNEPDRNAAIRTLTDQLIEGLAAETAIALLLRTALVCEQTARELRVKLLKVENPLREARTGLKEEFPPL